MNYATMWKRFVANCVDLVILIPITVFGLFLTYQSKPIGVLVIFIWPFIHVLYAVYFHARSGQTPGKMAAKIKVVRPDGSPITFSQAFRRSAVDFALAIPIAVCVVYAVLQLPTEIFQMGSFTEWSNSFKAAVPKIHGFFSSISQLWIWGEVVTMLFNERRRAIHDFIADTVVVRAGE